MGQLPISLKDGATMPIPDFWDWENSLDSWRAGDDGPPPWEEVTGEVDCRMCARGKHRQCLRKSENGPCYCWDNRHFGQSVGRVKVVRDERQVSQGR